MQPHICHERLSYTASRGIAPSINNSTAPFLFIDDNLWCGMLSLQHEPGPKRAARDWEHETSCFLCHENKEVVIPEPEAPTKKKGKGKKKKKKGEEEEMPPPPPVTKLQPVLHCSVCPRAYHASCLPAYYTSVNQPVAPEVDAVEGNTPEKGRHITWFICPQHKCATCNRNTSSSGGLLFRCAEVCRKPFLMVSLSQPNLFGIPVNSNGTKYQYYYFHSINLRSSRTPFPLILCATPLLTSVADLYFPSTSFI